MPPTKVIAPDMKAIAVFIASTASPERGGLPYLDAVLPAEDRLAATRVVRDLGALPPDAILYLLAQPLLDLASDQLMRDRDLTTRYAERFEVEGTDDLMPGVVSLPQRAQPLLLHQARHAMPPHGPPLRLQLLVHPGTAVALLARGVDGGDLDGEALRVLGPRRDRARAPR